MDGHIPGAAFVDWVNEIAETDANGVPAQLLQPVDRLHVVFGEKGVGLRKRVVVYDSGTHVSCVLVWGMSLIESPCLIKNKWTKLPHTFSCLRRAAGGRCGWPGTGRWRC